MNLFQGLRTWRAGAAASRIHAHGCDTARGRRHHRRSEYVEHSDRYQAFTKAGGVIHSQFFVLDDGLRMQVYEMDDHQDGLVEGPVRHPGSGRHVAPKAIGNVNADAEDETAANVEQVGAIIQKNVRVAVIPEPGTIALESDARSHELTPEAQFWLHTVGMGSFGLPELEVRRVPAQWVSAGDLLEGDGPVPLQFQATESPDDFWKAKGVTCLRFDVVAVHFLVTSKEHGPASIH